MKINIGTELGNIVGVEINKTFEEIEYGDIRPIVREVYGDCQNAVYGWAPNVERKELTQWEFMTIRRKLFQKGLYNIPFNKKGMPVPNEECYCLLIDKKYIKFKDIKGFLKTIVLD